ncbi:MAG: hypothetical protein ABIF89_01040 [bacterium]
MRIFELYFNQEPKRKPLTTSPFHVDQPEEIFSIFSHEPENVYEKRMGYLLTVAELANAFPQDNRFLENLAKTIKGKYYVFPLKTPEQSFKESLKRTNEFLSEEVKKDNVSWLGNLAFTALVIKKLSLNFTKIGDIKVLLLRNGKINDIGKNLDLEEIDPYPLKVFNNIVSGNLTLGDRLMVLTKDVFKVFIESIIATNDSSASKSKKEDGFLAPQTIIQEITLASTLGERKIREILKLKEKSLSEISGVAVLIDLENLDQEEQKVFSFAKEKEKFSLSLALAPIKKRLAKAESLFKSIINKSAKKPNRPTAKKEIPAQEQIKKPSLPKKPLLLPKINLPKIKITAFFSRKSSPAKIKKASDAKDPKKLILLTTLACLLLIGAFIFKKEENQKHQDWELIYKNAQEKTVEADNFFYLGNKEQALLLLKEVAKEISFLDSEDWAKKDDVISMKKTIEEKLAKIYNLESVDEPEVIFDFNQIGYIPQRMIAADEKLYIFSSISPKIFSVDTKTKKETGYPLPAETDGISYAAEVGNGIVFFSQPNKILVFQNGSFVKEVILDPPYLNFDFDSLFSFQSNLYFFESNEKEIIKYSYVAKNQWGDPNRWLKDKLSLNPRTGSGSFSTDGIIWILNENNSISRYLSGEYEGEIMMDFSPAPKNLYKILVTPSSPYIYLLEPMQKRVIVLEKSGRLVKQVRSTFFDNLKDIAISSDGKTIWLLNGSNVYKLEF